MALDRSHQSVILAGLLALTALTYAPLWGAGWVHEDQIPAPSRGLVAELAAFQPTMPRALTVLSLRVQGGSSVRAFHLGNLALHLTNGVLLSALLPQTPLGLFAVGAFLLHPINSEAVSYLSARADLIMGMMVLATLLAARAPAETGWIVCGLLGCWWAKESGVVAVGLLALWQIARRRPLPLAALALTGLAGAYASYGYLSGLHTWIVPGPSTFRFLELQAAGLWRMALLVVAPSGFTIEHDWQRLPSLLGLWLFTLTIALGVTAWTHRRQYPSASFALLWSLVALAPRWFVVVPHGLQEHHFYVPFLGLYLSQGVTHVQDSV